MGCAGGRQYLGSIGIVLACLCASVAPRAAGLSRAQLLRAAAPLPLLALPRRAEAREDASRTLLFSIAAVMVARKEAGVVLGKVEEGDLEALRPGVKRIIKGSQLRDIVSRGWVRRDGSKDEAIRVCVREGVEYLAQVIEFDGWDELKMDTTSRVAVTALTKPGALDFSRKALRAAMAEFDKALSLCDPLDVQDAAAILRFSGAY